MKDSCTAGEMSDPSVTSGREGNVFLHIVRVIQNQKSEPFLMFPDAMLIEEVLFIRSGTGSGFGKPGTNIKLSVLNP